MTVIMYLLPACVRGSGPIRSIPICCQAPRCTGTGWRDRAGLSNFLFTRLHTSQHWIYTYTHTHVYTHKHTHTHTHTHTRHTHTHTHTHSMHVYTDVWCSGTGLFLQRIIHSMTCCHAPGADPGGCLWDLKTLGHAC